MAGIRPHAHHSISPIRALAGSLLLLTIQFSCPSTGVSAWAQTLTVLHTFTRGGDGRYPTAGVLRDANGNLYGTTSVGGSLPFGSVFRVDTTGKETILHNFWGGDGLGPSGQLIRDEAGTFYSTTTEGGTPEGGGCDHGCGTVFKLDGAGKVTVLYAFTGGTDGANPYTDVVRDEKGTLYGTAGNGGDLNCSFEGNTGCGVVFKVDKNGKETVLHAFSGTPDGESPSGGLIRDPAGNLYGVTLFGGTYDLGSVFKIDKAGKYAVLFSFDDWSDGIVPQGDLVLDAAGNLYGTTVEGGDLSCGYDGEGCGVVFKLDPTGNETVLYAFKGGADGSYPTGALTPDNGGSFYGATDQGGSTACSGNGCGTIFKLDAKGNETVLYSFTGTTDGEAPNGNLVMDVSGDLYGTTYQGGDSSCGYGGTSGCGVVFELTP